MKYLLTAAMILTLGLFASSAHAETETEIALEDAPKVVQKTITRFIKLLPKGAELEELVEEVDEDETEYEAVISVPDGAVYEIEINPKGKITEIEMEEDEDEEDEDEEGEEEEDGEEEVEEESEDEEEE